MKHWNRKSSALPTPSMTRLANSFLQRAWPCPMWLTISIPLSRVAFQEIGAILDQVENQLRTLSHELRPTILDDLGLVPALESLAESVSTRAGLSIRNP